MCDKKPTVSLVAQLTDPEPTDAGRSVTRVADKFAMCDSLLGRCGPFHRASLNHGAYNTCLWHMGAARFVSGFPGSKSNDSTALARERIVPFLFYILDDNTLSELHVSASTGGQPDERHQPRWGHWRGVQTTVV